MTETVFFRQFSHIGFGWFWENPRSSCDAHARQTEKKSTYAVHRVTNSHSQRQSESYREISLLGSHEFDDLLFLLLAQEIIATFLWFFSSLLFSPCLADSVLTLLYLLFLVFACRFIFSILSAIANDCGAASYEQCVRIQYFERGSMRLEFGSCWRVLGLSGHLSHYLHRCVARLFDIIASKSIVLGQ